MKFSITLGAAGDGRDPAGLAALAALAEAGLTTLVDIVVVFLFTKPAVSLLARTQFFGGGHRLSGLDPARLGATSAAQRATSRALP